MTNPLITCLCLTRNRREWLPKAIDCFLRQTYRERELLILADGDDVTDLIPRDDRIRFLVGCDRNVGTKRNLGCEEAFGDVIAIWDDDDYSAPGRLADQMERLQSSGKAVAGYHTMKFTDGKHWWRYTGGPSFALATSLCFQRTWWQTHRFQAIQVGQDEAFALQAAAAKQLASVGDLDLMYATNHAGNTSPRVMGGSCWTPLPGYQWQEAA